MQYIRLAWPSWQEVEVKGVDFRDFCIKQSRKSALTIIACRLYRIQLTHRYYFFLIFSGTEPAYLAKNQHTAG